MAMARHWVRALHLIHNRPQVHTLRCERYVAARGWLSGGTSPGEGLQARCDDILPGNGAEARDGAS